MASALADLAFASLPDPALLLDAEGRLVRANEAAVALLGDAGTALTVEEPVVTALPWLHAATERILRGADEAGLETELSPTRGAVGARLRALRDGGALQGVLVLLDDLAARRALEARERSAERLSALGTLAAGLAHEVNNPLACVLASLAFLDAERERIAGELGAGELDETKLVLDEARDAAQRVGRVVRALQSFGQSSLPFLAEVEVGPALEKAVELAEPDLRRRARLEVALAQGARVRASEALLVELFLALLANAAQAMPEGEPEEHTVRVELDTVDGEAWIVISDTGRGMRDEVRERAFEPFFTTGQGPGLGLSASHGIVTALGGSLALGGAPGRGTTATVRLPLAA